MHTSSAGFMPHGMCYLWQPDILALHIISDKAVRPQTPVVLLTGWGYRMLAESDIPRNVDRVLGKPPKLLILRSVLAELTDGMPT
jgi:hypothetical protein